MGKCVKCGSKTNQINQALKAAMKITDEPDPAAGMRSLTPAQRLVAMRSAEGKYFMERKYQTFKENPDDYVEVRLAVEDGRVRTVRGVVTKFNYGNLAPGDTFHMHVQDYAARPKMFALVSRKKPQQESIATIKAGALKAAADEGVTLVKGENTNIKMPESTLEWLKSYRGIGEVTAKRLFLEYGIVDRESLLDLGDGLYEVEGLREDVAKAILKQVEKEVAQMREQANAEDEESGEDE